MKRFRILATPNKAAQFLILFLLALISVSAGSSVFAFISQGTRSVLQAATTPTDTPTPSTILPTDTPIVIATDTPTPTSGIPVFTATPTVLIPTFTPTAIPPTATPTPGVHTVIIHPMADATVTSDFPNSNFGSSPVMSAQNIPRQYMYMKFDLQPFKNSRVISATLRLMSLNTHTDILRVQDVVGNWNENTINYNNRPDSSTTYDTIDGGFLNSWMTATVTQPLLEQNGGTISFRIATYDVDQADVVTNEGVVNQPELVVTYDDSLPFIPLPTPTPDIFTPSACSNSAADVIVILDVSSSIASVDKVVAKAAAKAFVDDLGANTSNRVGLIMFGSAKTSKLLSKLTTNYAAVKTAIDNIPDTISGSCIECASYMANQEIKDNSRLGVKRAVVMLSDGNVHGSLTDPSVNVPLGEQLVTEEVQRGYQTSGTTYYTVGVGTHVAKPFFPNLAQITGGKYYNAPTATDFAAIYDDVGTTIGIGNGKVSGQVFEDINNNNKYEPSDNLLSGWTVSIIGSGITGARTTTTGSSGTYSFGGLCNGDFRVSETPPQGWIQTFPDVPAYYGFRITTGNILTGRDFANVHGFTVNGNVFVDTNKNNIKDAGETNYTGPIIITSTGGSVATTGSGSFSVTGLLQGSYSIAYLSLPKGFIMVHPLTGPPPSFTVDVGPGCAVDTTSGASCDSGNNIINLNFAISDSIPWVQSVGMDMRFDTGYNNSIPIAPACGVGSYGAIAGSSSTPGILFTGDSQPNFGNGQSSTQHWVVGGTAYPDSFSSAKLELSTAYSTLLTKLQKNGEQILDVQTLPGCSDLQNCSLPVSLPGSVLQANGDITLNSYTFPVNKNIIFLIHGNLTVNGSLLVPNGSVVIFSAEQNIIVNKTVGFAASCTPGNSVIEGIFSANGDFIVDGNNNCAINGPDPMLRINGSVIVNAALQGGTFDNRRDLCADDLQYPTITFAERPDFLLNMPDTLRQKSFIYQEVAP